MTTVTSVDISKTYLVERKVSGISEVDKRLELDQTLNGQFHAQFHGQSLISVLLKGPDLQLKSIRGNEQGIISHDGYSVRNLRRETPAVGNGIWQFN